MTAPIAVHTVVIGGGQAGLAAGYHLARRSRDFVILDAAERTGDSWRHRWDSLRLFTPAGFSHLPGAPFPARRGAFPTKDEMADYLAGYAVDHRLPVEHRVRSSASSATVRISWSPRGSGGGARATSSSRPARTPLPASRHSPRSSTRASRSCPRWTIAIRPSSRRARCSSSVRGTPAPRSPSTSQLGPAMVIGRCSWRGETSGMSPARLWATGCTRCCGCSAPGGEAGAPPVAGRRRSVGQGPAR